MEENNNFAGRKIVRYDTQTGQPIYEDQVKQERKIVRYDTQTGQPIYEDQVKQERKIVGYDTQTGQPIYESENNSTFGQNEGRASGQMTPQNFMQGTMTGTELKKKKIPKKALMIGGGVAAVVIAGAAIVVGILMNKPGTKIMKAAGKTFVADEVLTDFGKMNSFADDNKFGMDVTMEVPYSEVSVNGTYAQDTKGQSLSVNGFIYENRIELSEYMDDSAVYIDGSILDSPLMYPYTESSDGGFLADYLGDDTLDDVDSLLKNFYASATQGSVKVDQKVLLKDFNELDFEKTDKKSFTVGGEEVDCAGYEFTIDAEFCQKLMDDLGMSNGDDYQALYNLLEAEGVDYGTESMYDLLQDMPDTDVQVYLHDGKIAGICLEPEEDGEEYTLELDIKGTDIPWHEMELKLESDGYESTVEFTAEKTGSNWCYTMEADGYEVGHFMYNIDGGQFYLYALDETLVEGSYTVSDKECELSLDSIADQDFVLDFNFKDSAEVEKISEGQNLKTMSEGDFIGLFGEMYGILY